MPLPTISDPAFANNAHWVLMFDDDPVMDVGVRFSEAGGLSLSTAVTEYRYCGKFGNGRWAFPGKVTLSTLVLRRGLCESLYLHTWMQSIIDKGFTAKNSRRDGSLTLMDGTRYDRPLVLYHFIGAYPIRLTTPPLNANASAPAVAIEELELHIDSFTRIAVAPPPP